MNLRARVLALALALLPLAVQAEPVETARAAVQDLTRAMVELRRAGTGRDRVQALTRIIGAHEDGLTALRASLREVALRESAIRAQLDRQSEDIARLSGVLMTVERTQGPALLLHPSGPLGTARAGMMVADLAPALQTEAARLAHVLRELEELRQTRAAAVAILSEALRSAQDARTELSQAIADRRDTAGIGTEDAVMQALLEAAETLQNLTEGLSLLPGADPVGGGFSRSQGTLPLPVRGRVLREAGEPDPAGVIRPGLTLATEAGALVTAPWAASVRYRGPLVDYANVIVLEPDEGYLLVLAGLELVYVRTGDIVAPGDPLGLMPGSPPENGEFLRQSPVAGRSETLYVELRARTQPIDPALWFDLTGAAR